MGIHCGLRFSRARERDMKSRMETGRGCGNELMVGKREENKQRDGGVQ